jgi:hypothetical protein
VKSFHETIKSFLLPFRKRNSHCSVRNERIMLVFSFLRKRRNSGETAVRFVLYFFLSSPPAFLAIGCGSGLLTVLVGRSSLPLPPWVTRRGAVWRGKVSHRLQHGHVTPPPTYLGSGEGDGQQQQQQQYFNPHPSASPASSIPLLLPPHCIGCSVHLWQGA